MGGLGAFISRAVGGLKSAIGKIIAPPAADPTQDAKRSEDVGALDRWVRVIAAGEREPRQPLSVLRHHPFLVLLGEPGIGKSTSLRSEAAHEGVSVLTVSEIMNGRTVARDAVLYLDALDEYRMDGSATDKVNGLAARLAALAPRRLRIACRAEDWRADADLRAIRAVAGEAGITVAQILPLDDNQILQILRALDVADPAAFVAEAARRSAGALLDNPLSLKLLVASVGTDAEWPSSRFDVFEDATTILSYEHNDMRQQRRERTAAEKILADADKAMLILLCTSARAIWRSSGPLPLGTGPQTVLMANALGMESNAVSDMLDTPFFTGTTDWFEPMHRSVAEFMGGRALARAVLGENRLALPVSRALAFISAPDGKAPAELRGLFAWFAAHLSRRGAPDKARLLVDRDAVSVLVYGDAAAFDLGTRRHLLANINRDDPYFLNVEGGSTAVGALAQEDLAGDLIAILNAPAIDHRLSLAFDVLRMGAPLATVRPVLRTIALDPARAEWQRLRAAAAWVNEPSDADALRRRLLDDLAFEAPSAAREAVRAYLIANMSTDAVLDADIESVLRDYASTPEDSTIMRLIPLTRALKRAPRTSLLDLPRSGWLPEDRPLTHAHEVHGVLDDLLGVAIEAMPSPAPSTIWTWSVNARVDRLDDLGEAPAKSLRRWLDASTEHSSQLFFAIFDDPVTIAEPAGSAAQQYIYLAGSWPGVRVIDALIARGQAVPDGADRHRIAREVAEIARTKQSSLMAFEAAWNWLSSLTDPSALERLTTSTPGPHEMRMAARKRASSMKRSTHRTAVAASYHPQLASIRDGTAIDALAEFSRVFLPHGGEEQSTFRDRIAEQSDDDIAAAAIEGFKEVAKGPPALTPTQIGEAAGRRRQYAWEQVALIGVDLLLDDDRASLASATPALALTVLNQVGWIQDDERRRHVEDWAWGILDAQPLIGAEAIREVWDGTLAVAKRFNHGLWPMVQVNSGGPALTMALDSLLGDKPNLAQHTLQAMLVGAADRLPPKRLAELAEAALAGTLTKTARTQWSLTLFALRGDSARDLLKGHSAKVLDDLLEGALGDGLLAIIPAPDLANRAARAAAIVRTLGPKSHPASSRPTGRLLQPYHQSDAVHEAIKTLSGNPDPAAGRLLLELETDSRLASWMPYLKHARARHLTILRDTSFAAPSPRAVLDAMAGNGPVNGADLRAIVVDELRELGRSMRGGSESPWRFYWNTDQHGWATDAKIENVGRDISLSLIRERLRPYGVPVALPEATRGLGTRADVLLTTGAGRNLPIEAKRHYHKDLWTAASDQLQGYATAEGADGNGVLLVFWYGTDWASTPSRTDKNRPASAEELERLLIADLPPALCDRTDVIVLDVSRPKGGQGQASFARKNKVSAAAVVPPVKNAKRAPQRQKLAGSTSGAPAKRSRKPASKSSSS